MYTLAPNGAAIKAFKKELQSRIDGHFRVKDAHLNEAIAYGLNFRTHASLVAALKKGLPERAIAFGNTAFVSRLTDLSDDQSAEAAGAMLDGAGINIRIVKRPQTRQLAHRHVDVAYDIDIEVTGVVPEIVEESRYFILPQFFKGNGAESFRVDSAHSFRHDDSYAVTRGRAGKELLTAKLVDGRWRGALYIYSIEHIDDDARCLKSVHAGLVRAILPVVSSRPRCIVFRPDRYQYGAWRVCMSAGPAIQKFWGSSPILFQLPELPCRHVIMDAGCMADIGVGKFIGGTWYADIYSNGVAEDVNPTGIESVKPKLLSSFSDMVREAGCFD